MPTSFSPRGFPTDWPRRSDEQVARWRIECAEILGFSPAEAIQVATSEVELHQLTRLVSQGCPPALAFAILS